MTALQLLLALAVIVFFGMIALILNSIDRQQREERAAAAKRHADLMACFHSITERGKFGNRLRCRPDHSGY